MCFLEIHPSFFPLYFFKGNTVNVLLGMGISWTLGSIYWQTNGVNSDAGRCTKSQLPRFEVMTSMGFSWVIPSHVGCNTTQSMGITLRKKNNGLKIFKNPMLTFDMNDIDLFLFFPGREFNCQLLCSISDRSLWKKALTRTQSQNLMFSKGKSSQMTNVSAWIWTHQKNDSIFPGVVESSDGRRKLRWVRSLGCDKSWVCTHQKMNGWNVKSPNEKRFKKSSKPPFFGVLNLHFPGWHVTCHESDILGKHFFQALPGRKSNGGFIVSGGWSWIRSFFFFL